MGNNAESGGQEELFLKAFDEYADALFRHSIIRVADRERAVELVHDTFTKAWSYIRRGEEIGNFRPFLYKVLNNLIVDEYRKRREDSLDDLLARDGADEGKFDGLRDGSLEQTVDALDARRALETVGILPEIYREVLTLRFVDGLGPKDIAALIEETENVVSVRLYRGIKILKERLNRPKGRR